MTDLSKLTTTNVLNEVKKLLYPSKHFIHTRSKEWDHPREDELEPLVQELIRRKVYPEVSQIGTPALKMVIHYGWDWHTYRPPLKCKHCSEDLRNHEYGPPFKKEMAIIDDDFVDHYECPKCRKAL